MAESVYRGVSRTGREIERFYGGLCYSRHSMETGQGGEWPPIELAWRQKLAAFWSILWPGVASAWAIVILTSSVLSTYSLERWGSRLSAAAMGVSLLGQALFGPRLGRKNDRSFR